MKEKSVVWVEPMLCVLGDPKFLGKTPLLLKKNIQGRSEDVGNPGLILAKKINEFLQK